MPKTLRVLDINIKPNNSFIQATPLSSSSASGVTRHDELANRGLADQHPISAITNLSHHIDFWNGTFVEAFNALVTSDGTTITMSLEAKGTGDLIMRFSDGETTLDCTPAATITLTVGSDTSPTQNYIYVLQSTKAVTVSTSGWPSTEHIKIAYTLVPSASFVQSDGVYINQNWNDASMGSDGQGHLSHMAMRSRRDGAYYYSGIDANGTDQSSNTSYFDYTSAAVAYFKSASGVIMQMHEHTVPAIDTSTDDILVTNWNGGAYHTINNLASITTDSTGTSLANKYFNVFFFIIGNKGGEYAPLMAQLPSGGYSSQSSAENDVDLHDNNVIPREYALESSTGVPVCRMTLRWSGGTSTLNHISTFDMRRSAGGGGGSGSGGGSSFADNQFEIYDEVDITKIAEFDTGSYISSGETRVFSFPDNNGRLVTDAPFDTTAYVRKAGAWSELSIEQEDNILVSGTVDGAITEVQEFVTGISTAGTLDVTGIAQFGTVKATYIDIDENSTTTFQVRNGVSDEFTVSTFLNYVHVHNKLKVGDVTESIPGDGITLNSKAIVDVTDAEAFLVRKNADGGDVFVVDTTNSRVGIGVNAPDHALHVYAGASGSSGALNYTHVLFENSANMYLTFLTPNNANAGIIFGDNNLSYSGALFYEHAHDKLSMYTGGTTSLTITDTKRLGIYETSPDAQLHVKLWAAAVIGSIIELASAQTANAFEINTLGGSGGDVFEVTATGNTAIAGTLDVTGGVGIDGDFDIATNKFTVASATGNTLIAGTLGVTGRVTAAAATTSTHLSQKGQAETTFVSKSAFTKKGDILVGTASGTFADLGVGTNNQVLTADSLVSGVGVKWADSTAGSGTQHYIPKWSTATELGDSIIQQHATASRIGIGQASDTNNVATLTVDKLLVDTVYFEDSSTGAYWTTDVDHNLTLTNPDYNTTIGGDTTHIEAVEDVVVQSNKWSDGTASMTVTDGNGTNITTVQVSQTRVDIIFNGTVKFRLDKTTGDLKVAGNLTTNATIT